MTHLTRLAVLATCLLGATASAQPAAPAAPVTANDAVAKVQAFYTSIKHVDAVFRQEVTNNTFGTTKSSDGEVWIAKPGKMRWDYREKRGNAVIVKKSFISNGTTLWDVEHDNKQVLKKNLQQDLMPVAITFLYGKGDLAKDFSPELDAASKYGGKGDVVLKLTPKQPSAQYKNLYLVVNPSDYHVHESVIVDASGNVNHFLFFNEDFEKPVKDAWFEFVEASVKNYRIVDLDQQQGSGAGNIPPPSP